MARYKVLIKRSAQKELETLPRDYLVAILKLIGALAENPRPPGSAKLSGEEKYRIRKGPYRVVYSIHDQELTVWVVKIAHRKGAYR